MRFFIDAQLPRRLATVFIDADHEATHAFDLPNGTDTKDHEILSLLEYDVVIVSKDIDFYHSALIRNKPNKLIYVKIGNTSRSGLIRIFEVALPKLVELLGTSDVIQLEEETIITIS